MIEKQDNMLDLQKETIDEIRGARDDMKGGMSGRLSEKPHEQNVHLR
jgi:hypothetical protein